MSCLRFKALGTEELSHDLQKRSSECDSPQSSDVGGSSSLAGRIFTLKKKKTEVDSRRSSVDSSQSSPADEPNDSGLYNWLKDLFSIFFWMAGSRFITDFTVQETEKRGF